MSTDRVVQPANPSIKLPSLLVAVSIMLVISLYPPIAADGAGKADHGLTMALLWAMSSGFVNGVGFVPRLSPLRWIFSGWACGAAVATAALLKIVQ